MWLISEHKPFVVFFIDTLCCWVCWVGTGVCVWESNSELPKISQGKLVNHCSWRVWLCGWLQYTFNAMAMWCRLFCICCSHHFAISTLVPTQFAGCVATQQIIHSHFLYFGIFHSHFPSRSALHTAQICIAKFTKVELWVKNCDVFQS